MERLFAALDLPDDVRGRLEAWGARGFTDPALRPVPRRVSSHDGLLPRLDAA